MERCSFGTVTGEGIRCRRPAEQLREIPGRERLTVYPVCLSHAEVIDRFAVVFPEWTRSEELRYRAAYLLKEAERLVGESHDLRYDRRDDQGRHPD